MKPKQNCGNCRYSEGWSKTMAGRINNSVRATCTYNVILPVVPHAVVLYTSRVPVFHRDGATCPVWEAMP